MDDNEIEITVSGGPGEPVADAADHVVLALMSAGAVVDFSDRPQRGAMPGRTLRGVRAVIRTAARTRPEPPPGPGRSRAVRGKREAFGCMPRLRRFYPLFCVCETQNGGRGMRFKPTIFASLLAPLDRRQVKAISARHRGEAYDKSFDSGDHLLALIFAQFAAATSLRGLAVEWNAYRQHHYHLGGGKLARSTLADANRRRPPAVFAEVFAGLAMQLDPRTRREGREVVRVINSTPIPLGTLCSWATCNGRIRGLKLHIVFDPARDCPRVLDITDATVNDAQIGRTVAIDPGATYTFDKGYCHYGWWHAIDAAGASFVTRPKINMRLEQVTLRPCEETAGDGFTVTEDAEVRFASKGDSRLPIRLRRVRVRRQDGSTITLLTNDCDRSALAIAALYKGRWQIELLFRWLKQNLRIRRFLGNNPNAIRLQIYAALIAYALLRLAARRHRVSMPVLRFTELVASCLFERRDLGTIERPPPVNPARAQNHPPAGQLGFAYA